MTVELCGTSFHCCNLPGRSNWQRNRHKHPQGVKDKNTAEITQPIFSGNVCLSFSSACIFCFLIVQKTKSVFRPIVV